MKDSVQRLGLASRDRPITVLAGLLAAALLGGCATITVPARTEQMKAEVQTATRQAVAASPMHEAIVVARVRADKKLDLLVASPLRTYDILSSDFERALQASLESAGLLAPSRRSSRFELRAELLSLDQSRGDFSGVQVTASVLYELTGVSNDRNVWNRTIMLPYTAKIGDAPILVWDRFRQAIEGAARVNIQMLIESLLAVEPPPPR